MTSEKIMDWHRFMVRLLRKGGRMKVRDLADSFTQTDVATAMRACHAMQKRGYASVVDNEAILTDEGRDAAEVEAARLERKL
jgi:Mn-dependent DtxR family transcriptional regulator